MVEQLNGRVLSLSMREVGGSNLPTSNQTDHSTAYVVVCFIVPVPLELRKEPASFQCKQIDRKYVEYSKSVPF